MINSVTDRIIGGGRVWAPFDHGSLWERRGFVFALHLGFQKWHHAWLSCLLRDLKRRPAVLACTRVGLALALVRDLSFEYDGEPNPNPNANTTGWAWSSLSSTISIIKPRYASQFSRTEITTQTTTHNRIIVTPLVIYSSERPATTGTLCEY